MAAVSSRWRTSCRFSTDSFVAVLGGADLLRVRELTVADLIVGLESAPQQDNMEIPEVCGIPLETADLDITAQGQTVEIEGLYCSSTGGYTVTQQELAQTGNGLEASVHVQPPQDEAVTHALDPLEFEAEQQVETGTHQVNYTVTVGNQTIHTGTETVEVDNKQNDQRRETRNYSLTSFRNWITTQTQNWNPLN